MNNHKLYPLWWIISDESKVLLRQYQEKYFGTGINIPRYPMPEIPVDYDKEMREKPYKPARVR